MNSLTKIILQWQQGDKLAESQLYQFAYHQLRTIAHSERQRTAQKYGQDNKVLRDCANNTTALIHDAYIKLAGSDLSEISSQKQFYLMAAKVMRQILIDNARAMAAKKRQVSDADCHSSEQLYIDQLLSIEQALDQFSSCHQRQSDVVKLKYFMGLKTQEISTLLGCSASLVEKDLKFSKAWLQLKVA